ncbi:hypothetical protein [Streptomyces coffeae]|uniref:Uncharacterized protein n=1 Tax=Streptomyces coffeae TaxID=621382 RepID=A0ABS1NDL4_9ACTN|nr:hypothetical protein [Streptomyces coffeae]MBL1098049.1 hypothetical protein [Streptomyces coffeae]
MADNEPYGGERPRMTMRVYTMARDGVVTARRPAVAILVGELSDPYGLGQAWPPCQCPRHRDHNRPDRFRRS